MVIPKEIRRTLRIREGDPLEIYTEKDGGVIFRKYSPMGELQEFAAQMCEAIGGATGHIAAVADRDAIIALCGAPKRELMDKPNSAELDRLMEQRKNYRYQAGDAIIRACDGADRYHLGVAAPILSQGDLMGCVMMLLEENDTPLQESDQKLAQTAAGFHPGLQIFHFTHSHICVLREGRLSIVNFSIIADAMLFVKTFSKFIPLPGLHPASFWGIMQKNEGGLSHGSSPARS